MVQQISSEGTVDDKFQLVEEDKGVSERDNSLGSQNEGSPTSPLAKSFSDGEVSGEVEALSEKGEG